MIYRPQPKLQINIYDPFDLTWKAMLDSAISFTHRSSWNEIVNSELKIAKNATNIEEVQIGRIVVVNNQLDKALVIEEMQATLTDEFWTVSMIPLKGILNWRICHPTDSGTYTARKQADVMMSLVNGNLITQTRDNDRKFWNTGRTKNMLSIASIKTYGAAVDFKADWKTGLLGEALVNISKMYAAGSFPIGWNISILSTLDGYQLDTFQGVDRTVNQTANPTVIFSDDYGNVNNANYDQSNKDWRNVLYMSYNDGTTDLNKGYVNLSKGATYSFNRKEDTLDSSKQTLVEVQAEATAELNKRLWTETFSAETINNPYTMSTYNINWSLGDIVTIQSRNLKKGSLISVNAQITEIEEVYDSGEYSISATFGESKMTIIDLIKNAINARKI